MPADRYFVFDTETTGIGPDKEAVDIAVIEIDPVTLEETGRCESLIMPRGEISPEAQAVHGITKEMLIEAKAPYIEEWVEENIPGGFDGEVALIGHRIDFDLPLFAPLGRVHTLPDGSPCTVDTLLLTQLFCPVKTENRKLDTLKEALRLPGGGQSHRALADCCTALQLLQYLMPHTGRDLHSIAHTEKFVLHYMPWGKHEDKLLMKVPRQYREWLLTLENLDRHLRYSLEQVALTDIPLPKPRAPWERDQTSTVRRTIIIPPRRTT